MNDSNSFSNAKRGSTHTLSGSRNNEMISESGGFSIKCINQYMYSIELSWVKLSYDEKSKCFFQGKQVLTSSRRTPEDFLSNIYALRNDLVTVDVKLSVIYIRSA